MPASLDGPDPRVVVIDDHPAVVAGMTAWFAGAGITVVDSGPDPDVASRSPGASADVVTLDLQLSGRGGLAWDALETLVSLGRRVVVYTMREDERTQLRCLEAGCSTVLTKAEGEDHLVAAVAAAAHDEPYVAPSLAGAMSVDDSPERPHLTEREREVLLAWFQCESKQMVAARCGLSPRTVEGYLDRVRVRYARAGRPAPTKASLVARALQDGLVDLDDL